MRRAAGFTLLEVLLATALLAAGLALAFATVRSATAMGQRGEARVQATERMRGVLDVLRTRLQTALPLAFEEGADGQTPPRFDGGEQRLRFVSEVPAYVGRGGPYLHELVVRRSRDGRDLELALGLVMVQAGVAVPEQTARAPEVIADGLASVQLRYRGIDPDSGQLGPWQTQWPWARHQRGPLLVGITVVPRDAAPWPEMVAAIPQVAR